MYLVFPKINMQNVPSSFLYLLHKNFEKLELKLMPNKPGLPYAFPLLFNGVGCEYRIAARPLVVFYYFFPLSTLLFGRVCSPGIR
jgi:hypothetical protein